MKIFNVRKHFATNSSSSHSILCLDKDVTHTISDDCNIGEYHWDYFTAASSHAKLMYLAGCVKSAYYNFLQHDVPDMHYEDRDKLSIEKTAFLFPEIKEEILSQELSVDHQSLLLIPENFHSTDLNAEYINDLKNYLLSPSIVIVGGNDNDDEKHHLSTSGLFRPSELEGAPKETGRYIARKGFIVSPDGAIDETKSFWSLFSRDSGSKYRLAFDDSIENIPKSASPELADVCLTDYCTFGCEFCYQDSTKEGKHASLENIEYIAKELSKAQVYEACAGGGEVTLHPDFARIVDIFHENDIVFNFTTKNLNFFKKEENRKILSKIGAFAFSAEGVDDVEKLKTMITLYPEIEEHASIQYVMGSSSLDDFKALLVSCAENNIKPTLLGYKTQGRGSSFTPFDYSSWLSVVKEVIKEHYLSISIDTQLAGQSQREMKKHGIPAYTFHTVEGAHSIYVDAVEKTIAPSSYIGKEQTLPMTDDWLQSYLTMSADAANQAKPAKKIKIKSI